MRGYYAMERVLARGKWEGLVRSLRLRRRHMALKLTLRDLNDSSSKLPLTHTHSLTGQSASR